MMTVKKIKAGRYALGKFEIVRDDEECSGTYRLWNIYTDGEWEIECDTLRDAVEMIHRWELKK